MAAFEYTALDNSGKQRKGVVEGESSRHARQLLRDQGLSPMSVAASTQRGRANGSAAPKMPFSKGGAVAPLDLALLTRQLATLVAAGLPVEESLHTIARQTEKRRLSSLMMDVRGRVLEGHSLAAALGDHPNAFSSMYRSTVAAGEQSGFLGAVLDNLADHVEERFESSRSVQMAMFYPVLLFIVSLAIIAGLMTYVVPRIVDVFAETGQSLPFLTTALIATSDALREYWWMGGGVVVVVMLAFRQLRASAHFRLILDRQQLSMPLVRKLVQGGNASRYASTLAILTSSGVPLVDAMKIATEVVSNSYVKMRLAEAVQSVNEGNSLQSALETAGQFPPMFLRMIGSGEASGELDTMLAKVAGYQQQELVRMVTTLVQLFQPLMLLLQETE